MPSTGKADFQEYICLFRDGPAKGERIHLVVPPSDVRWFLEMDVPSIKDGEPELVSRKWWVMDHEPEPDPGLRITKYEMVQHFARREPKSTYVMYEVKK